MGLCIKRPQAQNLYHRSKYSKEKVKKVSKFPILGESVDRVEKRAKDKVQNIPTSKV